MSGSPVWRRPFSGQTGTCFKAFPPPGEELFAVDDLAAVQGIQTFSDLASDVRPGPLQQLGRKPRLLFRRQSFQEALFQQSASFSLFQEPQPVNGPPRWPSGAARGPPSPARTAPVPA